MSTANNAQSPELTNIILSCLPQIPLIYGDKTLQIKIYFDPGPQPHSPSHLPACLLHQPRKILSGVFVGPCKPRPWTFVTDEYISTGNQGYCLVCYENCM